MKTQSVTDAVDAAKKISDVQFVGDVDQMQLLSKAWSPKEGWMKSTKAMGIPGVGCMVQVTTQQGENVAEAVTFIPGVIVVDDKNGGRKMVSFADEALNIADSSRH